MSSLGVDSACEETAQKQTVPQLPAAGGGIATVWRRDRVGARWIWMWVDGGDAGDGVREGGRIE